MVGMTTLTSTAPAPKFNAFSQNLPNSRLNVPGSGAEFYVPLAPVLHIFGSRSGISHLLHAPIANPSEIAIRTVQIFPMRATPLKTRLWQISFGCSGPLLPPPHPPPPA